MLSGGIGEVHEFEKIHSVASRRTSGAELQSRYEVNSTGADRDSLDINGELVKLVLNITFGHGIHAGIHFRSSTHQSLLLGEQVALSVLQDRARGYNEPFTIKLRKFDGTTATISNQ